MKCLFYFSISSMKEGTSAQLRSRVNFMGGLGYNPSYFEKVYFRLQKRDKNT